MQMNPREVILALVLVDLPINLDTKDAPMINDGYGASWWYLVCECDDCFVSIVEEVVTMCSFPQIRSLCLLKNGSGDVLLVRATPKCKSVLYCVLRILGRYEFVDSSPIYADVVIGVEAFNALDFGTHSDPIPEGKCVVLKCYTSEKSFLSEVSTRPNPYFTFGIGLANILLTYLDYYITGSCARHFAFSRNTNLFGRW
jgi:hypothetical protein